MPIKEWKEGYKWLIKIFGEKQLKHFPARQVLSTLELVVGIAEKKTKEVG